MASSGDLIGIVFLALFFGGIYFLIGWAVLSALVSSLETGAFGEITWYGFYPVREGGGVLLLLFGLIKGIPIFLKVLTFFVNYKLTLKSICSICGDEKSHIDLPDKKDPF
ncbi:hypothetical protein ACWJJH_03775 [Endozoicomonadaceae bacterium StTr2]